MPGALPSISTQTSSIPTSNPSGSDVSEPDAQRAAVDPYAVVIDSRAAAIRL